MFKIMLFKISIFIMSKITKQMFTFVFRGYFLFVIFMFNFNKSLSIQYLEKQNISYFLHHNEPGANNFQPLRFYIHFEESKFNLKDLKLIFEKATKRVSQLLYVIPVNGSLLLERLSCERRWFSGKNVGRCASIGSKYKGEFCENKIDKFKIPESHLQELHVFNSSEESPIFSLPSGDGVLNTDYIFYLKSETTNWCQQERTVAYASCCRFDQFKRPVAGFINFCPNILNTNQYNEKYIFNVIIHEIFHALGFAKDMFLKFCQHSPKLTNCERRKNIVSKDSDDMYRLIMPNVVREMRNHFNCSYESFGAPLETDESGMYGSHWDNYLMYGSIMTANMGEPQHTAIDRISLAVFADSGWYRVNYTAADPYFWGKGSGCDFGHKKSCFTTEGLCDVNSNASSAMHCDFLHQTASVCYKLKENDSCGIYKPNTSNDCSSHGMDIHDGIPSYQACFQFENFNEDKTMCAPYKCDLEYQVEVFIDGQWYPCPYNTLVQVHNLTVVCPTSNTLCLYTKFRYGHLTKISTFVAVSTSHTSILILSTGTVFLNMVLLLYRIAQNV